MILKDKNGIVVSSFKVMDDGIVYGYIGNPGSGYTTTSLNQESCTALNFNYTNNCFWNLLVNQTKFGTNLDSNNKIKITPENISKGETILSFEYVIQLNVNELTSINDLGEKLTKLKVDFNLYENNISYYKRNLFNGSDLYTHLNSGIGIYTKPGLYTISQVGNFIQLSAGFNIVESKLLEGWSEVIEDFKENTALLNNIVSKSLQIGLDVENYFDGVYVKLNNLMFINKTHLITNNIERIEKNLSFEFDRVVDNKKVWSFDKISRKYEEYGNHTSYNSEENLIINNKELDLSFSPSNIPFNKLWVNTLKSRSALSGIKYNLTGEKINFSGLISDLTEEDINTFDEFKKIISERLSNVQGNRIKGKNNLFNLIKYSLFEDNISLSNYYSYTLDKIKKIDEYWMDFIEEFIPSTTIWSGSIKISNNPLENNKFSYKASNINSKSPTNTNSEINFDVVHYIKYTIDGDPDNELNGVLVTEPITTKLTVENVSYSGIQESPLKISVTNE